MAATGKSHRKPRTVASKKTTVRKRTPEPAVRMTVPFNPRTKMTYPTASRPPSTLTCSRCGSRKVGYTILECYNTLCDICLVVDHSMITRS